MHISSRSKSKSTKCMVLSLLPWWPAVSVRVRHRVCGTAVCACVRRSCVGTLVALAATGGIYSSAGGAGRPRVRGCVAAIGRVRARWPQV